MKVITLDRAKYFLGITDSSQDAAITAAIPVVDAAVKTITGNQFNYQIVGAVVSGSDYVEVWALTEATRGYYISYKDPQFADYLEEYLETGQLISGDGIPADTYVDEVYINGPVVELGGNNKSVPTIKLSTPATATDASAQLFLGINISYHPIIAKGIQWHINQLNTTITDDGWQSRSMGPVSVTKSSRADKIDGQSGMPFWFVRAFPRYMSGH